MFSAPKPLDEGAYLKDYNVPFWGELCNCDSNREAQDVRLGYRENPYENPRDPNSLM